MFGGADSGMVINKRILHIVEKTVVSMGKVNGKRCVWWSGCWNSNYLRNILFGGADIGILCLVERMDKVRLNE